MNPMETTGNGIFPLEKPRKINDSTRFCVVDDFWFFALLFERFCFLFKLFCELFKLFANYFSTAVEFIM